LAEQAAWKFMEINKPSFDMTVLNPYVIIGPMLQPVAGPENVPSTNIFPVSNFLNGTYKDIATLLFPAWHFVSYQAWELTATLLNVLRLMSAMSPARTSYL
jgi:hypothetical protein